MIVANKFQTGFDQPKLCAMYVDKKLGGVECVQTLSRLNRTYPGKAESGTFVLDFFNEPEDILGSFQPYYQTAELADVSDPDQIFDLFDKLRAAGAGTDFRQFRHTRLGDEIHPGTHGGGVYLCHMRFFTFFLKFLS